MAQVEDVIIAYYAQGTGLRGNAAAIAVAIALAESGGNASNVSPPNTDGSRDHGLWQINDKAHPNYDVGKLLDGAYNAKAMHDVSNGGANWGPWSTYDASVLHPHNNGSYQNFLARGKAAVSGAPLTNSDGGLAASIPFVSPNSPARKELAKATGLDAIAEMFGKLFSLALWKRVGIIALGLLLLILGFVLMVGSTKTAQSIGKVAAL